MGGAGGGKLTLDSERREGRFRTRLGKTSLVLRAIGGGSHSPHPLKSERRHCAYTVRPTEEGIRTEGSTHVTGRADKQKGCRNATRGERQRPHVMIVHKQDSQYVCRCGEGEALLRMFGGRRKFEARRHTKLWECHLHRSLESSQQDHANSPCFPCTARCRDLYHN